MEEEIREDNPRLFDKKKKRGCEKRGKGNHTGKTREKKERQDSGAGARAGPPAPEGRETKRGDGRGDGGRGGGGEASSQKRGGTAGGWCIM